MPTKPTSAHVELVRNFFMRLDLPGALAVVAARLVDALLRSLLLRWR